MSDYDTLVQALTEHAQKKEQNAPARPAPLQVGTVRAHITRTFLNKADPFKDGLASLTVTASVIDSRGTVTNSTRTSFTLIRGERVDLNVIAQFTEAFGEDFQRIVALSRLEPSAYLRGNEAYTPTEVAILNTFMNFSSGLDVLCDGGRNIEATPEVEVFVKAGEVIPGTTLRRHNLRLWRGDDSPGFLSLEAAAQREAQRARRAEIAENISAKTRERNIRHLTEDRWSQKDF